MKWLPDDLLDVHPGKRSSPNEDIIKFNSLMTEVPII